MAVCDKLVVTDNIVRELQAYQDSDCTIVIPKPACYSAEYYLGMFNIILEAITLTDKKIKLEAEDSSNTIQFLVKSYERRLKEYDRLSR